MKRTSPRPPPKCQYPGYDGAVFRKSFNSWYEENRCSPPLSEGSGFQSTGVPCVSPPGISGPAVLCPDAAKQLIAVAAITANTIARPNTVLTCLCFIVRTLLQEWWDFPFLAIMTKSAGKRFHACRGGS